jgi:hypothetical protein
MSDHLPQDLVGLLPEIARRVRLLLPEQEKRSALSCDIFVVMSFDDDMEPIYEGIRDAAEKLGRSAVRVKDVPGDYRITSAILSMIEAANLLIVDMTYERPNVYFELGLARGLGKDIITVARKGTNLHFDVKDWPCFFYNDSRTLERFLESRLR